MDHSTLLSALAWLEGPQQEGWAHISGLVNLLLFFRGPFCAKDTHFALEGLDQETSHEVAVFKISTSL